MYFGIVVTTIHVFLSKLLLLLQLLIMVLGYKLVNPWLMASTVFTLLAVNYRALRTAPFVVVFNQPPWVNAVLSHKTMVNLYIL